MERRMLEQERVNRDQAEVIENLMQVSFSEH